MNHNTEAMMPPEDEIDLLDLIATLAESWKLLLFGPLLAGLAALGISFVIPPTYTATTTILPPQQQQSSAAAILQSFGAAGGLASAATGLKNPADQYVAILRSRSIADRLIDRFQLMARYEQEYRLSMYKALEKIADIQAGKDGLITISVDDKDPQFAANLANAYVEELKNLLGTLAVTEAQQRRLFFEKLLEETKDKLTAAQQALQASGLSPDTIKNSPDAAVGNVAQLQAQIAAAEVRLGRLRGFLAENAPEVQQTQREIAALRAQLAKLEAGGHAGDRNSADYIARYRDFKYYETLFEMYAKQYELARADEARDAPLIQVIDPAVPPDYKSKPKRGLIAVLVTLGTGFILVLFVFLRRAWRNAQEDPEARAKIAVIRSNLGLGKR